MLAHTDDDDRPAVRRRRPRRGRAEGHRPLDRAERARPRRPDHRHRRGHLRPVAVRARRAARARPADDLRVGAVCRHSGVDDDDAFIEDVRRALYASKVVAYAQGFDHISAGSDEYGWDVDPGALATIWRGGCIIRARFLDRIREAYDDGHRPRPAGRAVLRRRGPARRSTAGAGSCRRPRAAGVPTPAFSSSLAYFDASAADRLPAALIQGLRDNFGAHTYRRVDRDGILPRRMGRRPQAARGLISPASSRGEPGG